MRILIYHIGFLGDTLVAVPSLWVIRDNFRNAHIAMLTDEQPGQHLVQPWDILNGSGLVDDYITYPGLGPLAMARLLFSMRARKFDALVYLIRTDDHASRISRDIRFFKLAGIKNVIGTKGSGKYPPRQPGRAMPVVPQVVDTLLARLRASGLRTPPLGQGRVDVNIDSHEQDSVNKWLAGLPFDGGTGWVALGLGSKMPCKIWPFERYLTVVSALIEDYDLWPVIFGGPGEREVGGKLVSEFGRGYVAAGELTVRESIAAMKRCLFFLGNDTGTMHMAAAAGLRCVVPFSSRDYRGKWYPYGEGHVVLRTPVTCEGCMLEKCVERKMQCILSISVEHVLQSCRTILHEQTAIGAKKSKECEVSIRERSSD